MTVKTNLETARENLEARINAIGDEKLSRFYAAFTEALAAPAAKTEKARRNASATGTESQ